MSAERIKEIESILQEYLGLQELPLAPEGEGHVPIEVLAKAGMVKMCAEAVLEILGRHEQFDTDAFEAVKGRIRGWYVAADAVLTNVPFLAFSEDSANIFATPLYRLELTLSHITGSSLSNESLTKDFEKITDFTFHFRHDLKYRKHH